MTNHAALWHDNVRGMSRGTVESNRPIVVRLTLVPSESAKRKGCDPNRTGHNATVASSMAGDSLLVENPYG